MFDVDLDAAPNQRWRGAVKTVLDVHPFEWSFGAAFAQHNKTLFQNVTAAQYTLLGQALSMHYPDSADELRGISEEFQSLGHAVTYECVRAYVRACVVVKETESIATLPLLLHKHCCVLCVRAMSLRQTIVSMVEHCEQTLAAARVFVVLLCVCVC